MGLKIPPQKKSKKGMITQTNLSNPKNPFVCPKTGIIPTFLFFSDGIGTQNILLDRSWLGFFLVHDILLMVQKSGDHHLAFIKTFCILL